MMLRRIKDVRIKKLGQVAGRQICNSLENEGKYRMKRNLVDNLSWLKHIVVLATGLALASPTSHAAEQAADKASVDKNWAPAWVKQDVPEQIKPYVGKQSLPAPWAQGPDLGDAVIGADLWLANHFIVYRKETAKFLYNDYTPLKVDYRKGTFPVLEQIVVKYTAAVKSDKDKAVILLTKGMPALLRHPAVPPYKALAVDRNLNEEGLIKSGEAWCNEQARVFIRLCQVAGIPARMIHLFYSDNKNGHTISEFYADGRWSMADSTYFAVFPAKDGHLMSVAEAHEQGEARKFVKAAYSPSFVAILKKSDTELGGASARQDMAAREELVNTLSVFGVVNYPLPR